MLDALASLLSGLLGTLTWWSPDPITRTNQVYRASFRTATKSGDWSDARLLRMMKDHSVPGAFSEFSGSLAERALAAWQSRTDPKAVRRQSRLWQDGIRPPKPTHLPPTDLSN